MRKKNGGEFAKSLGAAPSVRAVGRDDGSEDLSSSSVRGRAVLDSVAACPRTLFLEVAA